MSVRNLRDRIQECRDELGQVVGEARELERAEGENARITAGGRYGGWQGARAQAEADALPQREAAAAAALRRIRQAADRCATLLSEIERGLEAEDRGPGWAQTAAGEGPAESPAGWSRSAARGGFRTGRDYPNSTFGAARERFRADYGESRAYAPRGYGYAAVGPGPSAEADQSHGRLQRRGEPGAGFPGERERAYGPYAPGGWAMPGRTWERQRAGEYAGAGEPVFRRRGEYAGSGSWGATRY